MKALDFARWLCSGMLVGALALAAALPARAHRVTVFAWVEGDTVRTESRFSGGKAVNEGVVVVYDEQDRELLRGKTDENGEFSFEAPARTALKVVLEAGMGHKGEWIVPAEELAGVQAEAEEAPGPASPSPGRMEEGPSAKSEPEGATPTASLDAREIQSAMEKALDKKLAPVLKMLAEARREQGPSARDVFGGIGYILGLVGLGSYVHYRKKSGAPPS